MQNTVFNQSEYSQVFSETLTELCSQLPTLWQDHFIAPLSDFLSHLCDLQKQNKIGPIFCVSMSFLNTALMNGSPACRIDAYGADGGLYDHSVLTKVVDWPFFSVAWNQLSAGFRELPDTRESQSYYRPLQAKQAAWNCIGPILSMVSALLKYEVDDIPQTSMYKGLVKGDEFRIEFGEFWDWKVTLLAERQEVDLFNYQSRKHSFRAFQNKVFENKQFVGFDLSHCRFLDCEFRNCEFSGTNLNDCNFINCKFFDTFIKKCTTAGTCFSASTLTNVAFHEVTASFDGLSESAQDCWYRPMSMIKTSLEHVDFANCFLADGILSQCTSTYVTISESNTERSDFAVFESDNQE